MKPIETEYKDTLFRSRLEARWAVFFDCMEIPWDYEPDVIKAAILGDYIPDFRLQTCECWAEVKPVWPTKYETDKMRETGSCLLLVEIPQFQFYWRLTATDEICFIFRRGGIEEFGPNKIPPTRPDQFSPFYHEAVERALHARFDGYDQDRWTRQDRYA